MSDDEWTPPQGRPEEVAGATSAEEAALVREKWALYSKTFQGVVALGVIYIANRYFDWQLSNTDALVVSQAIFAALGMVALWWTLKGRMQAEAILYWLPRSREQKLEKTTGISVEKLLLKA